MIPFCVEDLLVVSSCDFLLNWVVCNFHMTLGDLRGFHDFKACQGDPFFAEFLRWLCFD